MENNKRTIIPISCDVIKTGQSSKDGKSWKWTLYRVQAVVLPGQKSQSFSSFDDFSGRIDQEVEVEVEVKTNVKDGKTYTNYSIRLPKRNVWNELDDLRTRIEKLELKAAGELPVSLNRPTRSENERVEEELNDIGAEPIDESLPF